MKSAIVSALALLLCLACGPKITNRYCCLKGHWKVDATCDYATGSAYALPVSAPSKAKGLADLRGRGQAALIAQVSAQPDAAARLFSHLGGSFKSAGRPPALPIVVDKSRVKRRLVFFLEREHPKGEHPGLADRLTRIDSRIAIDPGAIFSGWTRIETKYENLERGSLTRNQQFDTSLAVTAGPAPVSGVPVQGEGKVAYGESLEEKLTLREQVARVTPLFSEKQAGVLQQGGQGLNLTGNVTMDVEIASDNVRRKILFKLTKLRDPASRALNPPTDVRLTFELGQFAGMARSISGEFSFDYHRRHVRRGGDTTLEGDDHITMHHSQGCHNAKVTLASGGALRFGTYRLANGPRGGGWAVGVDRLEGASLGDAVVMDFESEGAAYEFLSWLTETAGALAVGQQMEVARRKLYRCDHDDTHTQPCSALTASELLSMGFDVRPVLWNEVIPKNTITLYSEAWFLPAAGVSRQAALNADYTLTPAGPDPTIGSLRWNLPRDVALELYEDAAGNDLQATIRGAGSRTDYNFVRELQKVRRIKVVAAP